ncbi:hypothetical protein ISS04_04790 [Candidatus Woesearchaeota archaeon]|nr:hypothetical protein [Candidatus Woesearchaeota archaeon]
MKIEDQIKQVFVKSWKVFVDNFVVLILGTLVALLMMIFIITIPPMIFGIYYMCAQLVNGKKIKVSDVFQGFNYFFRSWGIFILGALGVLLGLILLIVPGLLLIVLWQYAIAIAVIENRGVIDSLGRSFDLGKKHFAFSVVFLILVWMISTLGGLTKVGVLVTLPFSVLATCFAVMVLSGKSKKK